VAFFEPDAGLDAARMRELLAHLSCPLCGGTRETSLLVVIDGPPESTSVRAQCVRCHLFWSFEFDRELGLTAPVASREPHLSSGPITADEMLELHLLLDSQDSFEALLRRRAS
jgi:hypothetical protein